MSDSWSGSGAGDLNRPGRAGDCEFGNENGYSCVVCGEEGYESPVHDDRVTARERWRASAADDGSGAVTETAKESDGEVNPGDEVEGISEVGCEIWTGPHAGENGICEECENESGSGNYEERENDADAAASEVGENEEDHLVAVRRSTQGGKTERSARTPPLAPHPLSLGLSPRSLSKRLPPLPRPRPLPRPPPRASRSFARISSNRARLSRSSNARESPALAWRISSFFSSTNVRGTPAGESCASRRRFHRAVIKAGVFEVRKPVRLICILRGSGVCMHECSVWDAATREFRQLTGCESSSSKPMAYSTTTSSSKPTNSTTFLTIQGRMTDRFTFRMSTCIAMRHCDAHIAVHPRRHTFLSNSGGNFIVLRSFNSLSENRRSWSAEVPLKKPVDTAQTLLTRCRDDTHLRPP